MIFPVNLLLSFHSTPIFLPCHMEPYSPIPFHSIPLYHNLFPNHRIRNQNSKIEMKCESGEQKSMKANNIQYNVTESLLYLASCEIF